MKLRCLIQWFDTDRALCTIWPARLSRDGGHSSHGRHVCRCRRDRAGDSVGSAHPDHGVSLRRPPRRGAAEHRMPFTADLDEMVKRRAIRVGVTFNRTHYFIDRGQERGLTYERSSHSRAT